MRFSNLIRAPKVLLERRDHRLVSQAIRSRWDAFLDGVESGSVVRAMPGYGGSFEIDVRSHVLRRILEVGDYEAGQREIAGRYLDPSRDAVDIGANVGLYTVLIARKLEGAGRRVLAVEPTEGAGDLLVRNIARNRLDSTVLVERVLATAEPGDYEFHTIPGKEEYTSMGELTHSAVRSMAGQVRTFKQRGERLDDLVTKHGLAPGFIKVDTEGAEFLVFSGATETLRAHRPVVLFELDETLLKNFGHSVSLVLRLFEELGYRVIDASDENRTPGAGFAGDALALPG